MLPPCSCCLSHPPLPTNPAPHPALALQRVLDSTDPHFGYNAANGKYGNLMESGIIDPTKVRQRAGAGLEHGGAGLTGNPHDPRGSSFSTCWRTS